MASSIPKNVVTNYGMDRRSRKGKMYRSRNGVVNCVHGFVFLGSNVAQE